MTCQELHRKNMSGSRLEPKIVLFFQSIADLWYILKLGKFGSFQNQFQKTKTNANKEE